MPTNPLPIQPFSDTIWLRTESKSHEQRTPLTPSGVAELIAAGYTVSVEESTLRAYPLPAYADAGATIVAAGSWVESPHNTIILGLKELPDNTSNLHHTHIFFAHIYKEQEGWQQWMQKFKEGDGQLLDLEYLLGDDGRRVAAFGYWAGYVGCALGLLGWCAQQQGQLLAPQRAFSSQDFLLKKVKEALNNTPRHPSVVVMGAKGRCGQGAHQLIEQLSLEHAAWDRSHTRDGGPFPALLTYDMMVNCVLLASPLPPFLTLDMLSQSRHLTMLADISCDPNSPNNPLPLYPEITTMEDPLQVVSAGEEPFSVMAIDHLPSLLPKESSDDFAAQLLPHLLQLRNGSAVWDRALQLFHNKKDSL